jgi:hypothetical protein
MTNIQEKPNAALIQLQLELVDAAEALELFNLLVDCYDQAIETLND